MYKEIPKNNCQRQALKTELKTCTSTDSSVIYYSILVETSSRMSPYNVIIKTFITQLQKINRDCQLQIITFDENVNTVFEFETDPILLKENLKEIKFSKDNEEAKFGQALQACYANIESCWSSDNISKIIIFSSGKSTDESEDELVDILSLDNNTIFGFACGANSDEVVKDLQSLLPGHKISPLGKNPSKEIKTLMNSGGESNNSCGGSGGNDDDDGANNSSTNCPVNIEVYPHSIETRSIKEDLFLDVIIKTDGNTTTIPAGTKIKFLSSKYYSAYTIQLKDDLIFGEPYEETIRLEFKKGQLEKTQFEHFPSKINFTIELSNDRDNVHQGYVFLNISYFLGELKSKYSINIGVEGNIGNGKSTLLNGFINLFNPTDELVEYFIANRINDDHVTTSFNNTSLKEILSSKQDIHPVQESFHDIDISLSDNWGFIDTDVSLRYKAEGRIHHGVSKNNCIVQQPLDRYRVDCFIFVVSIRNFGDKDSMARIEKKIREVIDMGITPLLAITFVDALSKNQYQELIRTKNELSIQESNTFIINNYTEKETHRDISKDIQYLRLLTKAVQLCKILKEKQAMNKLKALSIDENNYSTPVKNQQPSSSSSSSSSSFFGECSPNKSFQSPMTGSPMQTRQSQTQQQQQQQHLSLPINVTVDVVPDAQGTILTSFEIESNLNETISELKNRLINEIDSNINSNDWSLTKENGTILFESAKLLLLSSSFKPSEQIDSIKLVLKKKLRL
ncbi:hypothetical protein ACTFIW_009973 [Dictyostelium discoideum]